MYYPVIFYREYYISFVFFSSLVTYVFGIRTIKTIKTPTGIKFFLLIITKK